MHPEDFMNLVSEICQNLNNNNNLSVVSGSTRCFLLLGHDGNTPANPFRWPSSSTHWTGLTRLTRLTRLTSLQRKLISVVTTQSSRPKVSTATYSLQQTPQTPSHHPAYDLPRDTQTPPHEMGHDLRLQGANSTL